MEKTFFFITCSEIAGNRLDFMKNVAKIAPICFLIAVVVLLIPLAGQGADRPVDPAGNADDKKTFSDRLGDNIQSIKSYFVEHSKVGAALENFQALRELMDLPDMRKEWLIRTTPALQELLDNPALKAVMGDERLLSKMVEAAEGSLSAWYDLGQDPSIIRLFKDKEFAAALKRIDLKTLAARAKGSAPAAHPSHRPSIFGVTCVPSHPQRVR